MIMQNIGGGLGNQILQYIFARFVERRNPYQTVIFDDTYLGLYKVHSGYELEKVFGIQVNLLSQCLKQDQWEGILSWQKKRDSLLPQVPQFFYHAGLPIVMVTTRDLHSEYFPGLIIFPDQLTPDLWTFDYSNVYCFGYWINNDWFEQDKEENRKELTFPKLSDCKNLKYEEKINTCNMPVGIHVRRGDYTRLGSYVSAEDCRLACKEVVDKFSNSCFFVFSDEVDWCKAHATEMGFDLAPHTIFVEGNNHGKNYIDMQLMSMCRGLIRPEISTFSMVAGLLTQDLEFERVLKPTT